MSFFAARNQVNCSLPLIDDARDWMKTGFLPRIEPKTQMFEYAGSKMLDDSELKQYMMNFIKRADFNITGVTTKKESVPIPTFVRSAILEDNQISKSTKEKYWQIQSSTDWKLILSIRSKTSGALKNIHSQILYKVRARVVLLVLKQLFMRRLRMKRYCQLTK